MYDFNFKVFRKRKLAKLKIASKNVLFKSSVPFVQQKKLVLVFLFANSQILDYFSVLLFLLNNIHAIDTISTNGTIITGENSGVTGVGVGEGVGGDV